MKPGTAAVLALVAFAPPSAAAQERGGAAESPPADADTLSLGRAVEIALRRSPELRQAVADQASAHAARRADLGSWLPTASAALSLSRTGFRSVTFPEPEGSAGRLDEPIESTTHAATQRLSIRWDLLRGGNRFARLRRGAAAARAADRRVAAAERSVVARVKRSYYDALMQQRLADVARRQLEGRRADLEITRRRYELAAVTRSDLLGAEINLADAELALLDARDRAAAFRRELGGRIGAEELRGEFRLRDVEILPDAGALEEERLLSRALSEDPTLGALEAEAAAAAAGVWAARASYLPTISLGYGYGRSETLGPEGSFLNLDLANRSESFSVTASWNLFDGLGRERDVAQAAAARRRAEAELLRRRLDLRRGVRDGVAEIRRRAERLEIQRRKLELASQRLELAREQYRLGTISYFDLQNAIRDLTQAELAVTRERYEYLKAWAGLEERVGELP